MSNNIQNNLGRTVREEFFKSTICLTIDYTQFRQNLIELSIIKSLFLHIKTETFTKYLVV